MFKPGRWHPIHNYLCVSDIRPLRFQWSYAGLSRASSVFALPPAECLGRWTRGSRQIFGRRALPALQRMGQQVRTMRARPPRLNENRRSRLKPFSIQQVGPLARLSRKACCDRRRSRYKSRPECHLGSDSCRWRSSQRARHLRCARIRRRSPSCPMGRRVVTRDAL